MGYEITVAVGQMDQFTQGVAANAEQNASVSVELSNQASLLENTIHDLQQLISIHDSSSVATETMNLKSIMLPLHCKKTTPTELRVHQVRIRRCGSHPEKTLRHCVPSAAGVRIRSYSEPLCANTFGNQYKIRHPFPKTGVKITGGKFSIKGDGGQ
jgi:hypothetical protein